MANAEELYIVGAGDHGRGTLEILLAAATLNDTPRIRGFLDDDRSKHGTLVGGLPVLGGVDSVRSEPVEARRYIIAIADCQLKRRIAERLGQCGAVFASAIHPRAFLGRGVRVGAGTIINAGVAVAYDTIIGEHTTINLNATVGHDCVIGAFTTVAPGANVAGRVRLGIGCDVGLNATVGKGLSVGDWATVGPGAVIIRDVDSGLRVFGNPARVIPDAAHTHRASAHVSTTS
jgi:sugar O-acyltransferase (sialic acid O-acetyltransferase NeuD family)